jgi:hypothetical protein
MSENREEADAEVREAQEEMERQADELERRTEELGEHVDEAKADWKRKRADSAVPGANPPAPEDADGGEVAGDWKGEGPAAGKAGQ